MWLWSAVLPMCWALVLAVRVLVWQIELFNRKVYLRTVEAATQAWWQRRCLALPVREVLLLGPAGDVQTYYQHLMKDLPLSTPLATPGATHLMLRCPLSMSALTERAPALAQHLARLTLTLPELSACWPQLRATAWVGDESSQVAFAQTLAQAGMVLPEARLPLRSLSDLDDLIDTFHRECHGEDDWLLCAGAVSVERAEQSELPGEGAFLWWVSRQGRQLLHRAECQADESPAELCGQMQRYAGLETPPTTCLALDKASQEAFALGGWSAAEHQLSGQWGVLAHLAPFIGMSLALLQAGTAGQPCGWLSQDGNKRLEIGVAVPYGNS
ncbi:hypothetical protein AWM79_01385 [Pseudomonas agarici]|uniref:Uncharacterized protein n=1 Tax=Pseudomonas agarici TaxID=46677 RepID=A0A0X1T7U9_PSEAA|nr:hypothetical protein [Pseudomonas agarici]AMB88188.1 hypothetical protein AWM79_01385 [Pseudomonas agarici]NWB94248.1 hypothetical protein [Pseudomonas agarici]NWC08313.1 hypothetical protein [Pseudomonas agarici]